MGTSGIMSYLTCIYERNRLPSNWTVLLPYILNMSFFKYIFLVKWFSLNCSKHWKEWQLFACDVQEYWSCNFFNSNEWALYSIALWGWLHWKEITAYDLWPHFLTTLHTLQQPLSCHFSNHHKYISLYIMPPEILIIQIINIFLIQWLRYSKMVCTTHSNIFYT